MTARILTVSALLLATGAATAQGYVVRTWGHYDPYPYPPGIGGTWSYSPYPPMVMAQDPWGRVADMPLRPKVLYYDTPFLTPEGWYRPTSIAVMPEPRPRAYTVPARAPQPIPSARPQAFEPIPPARPIPDVAPPRPAAKPIPQPSVPAEAKVEPAPVPAAPPRADLPPVPEVPKLPEVPQVPGAAPAVPKLGPTPMDVPPTGRPPG